MARAQLEACCSDQTLYGDMALLDSRDPGDGATMDYSTGAPTQYCIQDGDKVTTLRVGVNTVGRLPENQVVIRDECVSRRHCAIVVHRSGLCELHDVASKNGTVLNGMKIHAPAKLHPGDKIALCSRQIVFLQQQPAAS